MFVREEMKEERPGIYVREGQQTKGKEMKEDYQSRNLRNLKSDRYHYQCLVRKFPELFAEEFYSVADIGGGNPKLASHMNVSEITVYDQWAKMYEKDHETFLSLYPTDANIEYKKKNVLHPNFTPNAEVAIICHVLEHLSIEQIERMLGNLETNKVLIYGPNIGAAKNAKWFHFRPAEHTTFATLEAMCELVKEAGFTVKVAEPYSEDYIIFAEK
jgi:hypothetical protein